MKARSLKRNTNLWIAGERAPHKSSPQVLRHDDRDALVDAEAIRVIPIRLRMKRIAESISSPRLISIVLLQRTKHAQAVLRHKRKRPTRSARHHRSIDPSMRRRPTPRTISMRRV